MNDSSQEIKLELEVHPNFSTKIVKREDWDLVGPQIMSIQDEVFNGGPMFDEEFIRKMVVDKDALTIAIFDVSGLVIGYVNAVATDTDTAHIESIAIRQSHQKRGLVAKLSGALEDELRNRGCHYFSEEASVTNDYAEKIQKVYQVRIVEQHEHTSDGFVQRYFKIRLYPLETILL
jgi:ribosomal protein S18 acetylase RimI-like enzyme